MKPSHALFIIAIAMSTSLGCSMCCGPYDYDYPTYGGQHERVDRTYGRVGSLFSDPMAGHAGPSADSNLKDPESLRNTKPNNGKAFDNDTDADLEKFKKELESISPKNKPTRPELKLEDMEELPQPDTTDPTANRPQRSQWQWR